MFKSYSLAGFLTLIVFIGTTASSEAQWLCQCGPAPGQNGPSLVCAHSPSDCPQLCKGLGDPSGVSQSSCVPSTAMAPTLLRRGNQIIGSAPIGEFENRPMCIPTGRPIVSVTYSMGDWGRMGGQCYAFPVEHGLPDAYNGCVPEQDCAIGWSKFSAVTSSPTQFCATASNWSGNWNRCARITITLAARRRMHR